MTEPGDNILHLRPPDPAEAALLGAMLLSPKAVDAATAAGLQRQAFDSTGHPEIFDAIIDLTEAGHGIDALTVDITLRANDSYQLVGGGAYLTELITTTPAISNAATYAHMVRDAWTARRAMWAIANASEAVRQGEDPLTVISHIADRLPAPIDNDADRFLELDDFLDIDEPDHDWIIPGLIERGDRTIITARAGTGKSTLLRQIGVMTSSGLHPFTCDPIDPVRVLMLDTENSQRQTRRHLRPLRKTAGDNYNPGNLHVRVYGHSINLADNATATDLCRTVERLKPDIVLAGPLYKLAEGDPKDEQVAKAVADTFDRIRSINGSGLAIEAHSPYPVPGSKAKPTIRPYGASLWERWPEFGWYLAADGKTEHWRGQREEREWPTMLQRSEPWPWMPAEPEESLHEPWDGPTHCIEAVIHYLTAHPDEELSARQLETVLRASGNGYRTATVLEAAERAALKGDITMRIGPRKARLYSTSNQEKVDTSDPGF